jgi:hypothetical protein
MLVVASDTDYIHIKEQELWKLYMKTHPNVDCYFYKGDTSIGVPAKMIDDYTLLINIEETYENIYEKTMLALEFFEDKLDQYDYIFRTNLSSFVIFDRYIKHCESFSDKVACSAVVGYLPHKFPSGAGFTIAPEIARMLIKNRISPFFIDDVTIGKVLESFGVEIRPAPRAIISSMTDYLRFNDNLIHFHFRLKGEGSREDELIIMNNLINKYYSSNIIKGYKMACNTVSDISEHIPILYSYASNCKTIVECGVRAAVSSYAFALGLKHTPDNRLVMIDIIKSSKIDQFIQNCKRENINAEFITGSDIDCERVQTDLLFIDTWHVYGHLKRELNYWHERVNKYIIMHDTTVDEWVGESIRNGWDIAKQSAESGIPIHEIRLGLWPAVDEFLVYHPEWILERRYTNCNGLTILRKRA